MQLIIRFQKGDCVTFLAEWLDAADLCKLDSASCNQTNRILLLSLYSSLVLVTRREKWHINHQFYSWVLRRKIRLENIYLHSFWRFGAPNAVDTSYKCYQNINFSSTKRLMIDTEKMTTLNLEYILSQCEKINELIIKNNSLITNIPTDAICTTLTSITLHECKNVDVDAIKNVFQSCENIQRININPTPMCIFAKVSDYCPNLVELTATFYSIYLSHIAMKCPNLRKLSLTRTGSAPPSRMEMGLLRDVEGHLDGLETLYLDFMDDAAQAIIANACPNIHTLRTNTCNTHATLTNLLGSVRTSLTTLVLETFTKNELTDESMQHVAVNCPSLTMLSITELRSVSSNAVRQLLDKCSGLQFLCFRGLQSTLCTNVVATISLLSVPKVRYLDLSNCNVTNRELSILSRCKALEVLTLCGNHYITADGVLSVMMHCRTLSHLYLNQCPLVHASILFGNISIQPKGSVKYHMHMSTYASDSGVCILKKYYFPLDKKTGERRGVYIHNPPRGQYAYSTDPESMLPYV